MLNFFARKKTKTVYDYAPKELGLVALETLHIEYLTKLLDVKEALVTHYETLAKIADGLENPVASREYCEKRITQLRVTQTLLVSELYRPNGKPLPDEAP
jgi:hypothetical protein